MITRNDGRGVEDLREIKITPNFVKDTQGSCLYQQGDTLVLSVCTLQEGVPAFLKGQLQGWLTAEYNLLPYSCKSRVARERISGRTFEIRRLVGRALRQAVDLDAFPEKTLFIDCDVLKADGGTRTASVNAGFISLAICLNSLKKQGLIRRVPLKSFLGAVSVGLWKGNVILDLNYQEDAEADVDFNVVMNLKGKFVEIQGTAERASFSKDELDKILSLAETGIKKIFEMQKEIIKF